MLPTRKLPRFAYFWPGLPQLWLWGSWVHLAIAVGFTALANVLILATFVFHQWIPLEQRLGGYGLMAAGWLAGWWQYRRYALDGTTTGEAVDPSSAEPVGVGLASEPREQLFREAQQVYLGGDWVAAEQLLLKLLKLDDRDAEARLMLATLWRHQGRHREAIRQLNKLGRLEAGDLWQFEIAREQAANAAAVANEEINQQPTDDIELTDDTTTQNNPEPEIHDMADAEPSANDNEKTSRRWAA